MISRNITSDLKKIGKCNNLYFINLPDNLDGALLFRRRAIRKAIYYYNLKPRFNLIQIISNSPVNNINDSINISYNVENKSIVVSNLTPPIYFNYYRNSDFVINDVKKNGFTLNFINLNRDDKIFYYSAGNLKELKLQ